MKTVTRWTDGYVQQSDFNGGQQNINHLLHTNWCGEPGHCSGDCFTAITNFLTQEYNSTDKQQAFHDSIPHILLIKKMSGKTKEVAF